MLRMDAKSMIRTVHKPWFLIRFPWKYQEAMVSTMVSKWCERISQPSTVGSKLQRASAKQSEDIMHVQSSCLAEDVACGRYCLFLAGLSSPVSLEWTCACFSSIKMLEGCSLCGVVHWSTSGCEQACSTAQAASVKYYKGLSFVRTSFLVVVKGQLKGKPPIWGDQILTKTSTRGSPTELKQGYVSS